VRQFVEIAAFLKAFPSQHAPELTHFCRKNGAEPPKYYYILKYNKLGQAAQESVCRFPTSFQYIKKGGGIG
jgi:hypothetical protein